MIANVNNAVVYLVGTLLDLLLYVFLLRVLLHAVRADFYNPISQLVWKFTQPVVRPLQTVMPRVRTVDVAALLVLYLIAVIDVRVVIGLYNYHLSIPQTIWYALLKLAMLLLNLYTLTLFVQAILSWVGPGTSNPASAILWSLNEPLLRPVRRVIPSVANLDLSPMVVMFGLQIVARLLPLPGLLN